MKGKEEILDENSVRITGMKFDQAWLSTGGTTMFRIVTKSMEEQGKELAIGFHNWIHSSTWLRVKDGTYTSESGFGEYISTEELFTLYLQTIK